MANTKLKYQEEYFQFSVGPISKKNKSLFIGKILSNRFFQKRIVDVDYLRNKNHMYHGWAFLLDDGYWMFGVRPINFDDIKKVSVGEMKEMVDLSNRLEEKGLMYEDCDKMMAEKKQSVIIKDEGK